MDKFLDTSCPINWSHPLNYGLKCYLYSPVGTNGITASKAKDLVRGYKKHCDFGKSNSDLPLCDTRRGDIGFKVNSLNDGSGPSNYFVNSGTTMSASVADGFTMAFWVKRTASWPSYAACISERASTNAGVFVTTQGDNSLTFMWGGIGWSNTDSTISVPLDSWVAIAMTITTFKSDIRIWKNGSITKKSWDVNTNADCSFSGLSIGVDSYDPFRRCCPGYYSNVNFVDSGWDDKKFAMFVDESLRGNNNRLNWISDKKTFVISDLPPINGAVDKTFDALTQSSTGQLLIKGIGLQTFDAVQLSSQSQLLIQAIVSQTFDTTQLSSQSQLLINSIVNQAFDATQLSATGYLPIIGSSSYTLEDLLLSSIGTKYALGDLNCLLDNISINANSNVYIVGNANNSLEDLLIGGTGNIYISSQLNKILDNFSIVGIGNLYIKSQTDSALTDLLISSSANLLIQSSNAISLTDLELSSAGNVLISSNLSLALENLGVSSNSKVYIFASTNTALDSLSVNAIMWLVKNGYLIKTLGEIRIVARGSEASVIIYNIYETSVGIARNKPITIGILKSGKIDAGIIRGAGVTLELVKGVSNDAGIATNVSLGGA